MENEYSYMSIIELKKEASKRKIKYGCKMNKNELITILNKNDSDPTYLDDKEISQKCLERCRLYYDKEYQKNYHKTYSKEWRKNNKEKIAKNSERYWIRKLTNKGLI